MPAMVRDPIAERRRCRQDAPREIADVQVLAVHRRPGLGHLRGQHQPHRLGGRTHRERHPRSRMTGATTSPRHTPLVPERFAAAEPDARGVDRFLSERPKAFTLECRLTVADFPAGEERLQAGVGGARQHHAAEDLAAFVRSQRGTNRGPAQEAVAGVYQLIDRELESLLCIDPRRRFNRLRRGEPVRAGTKLSSEHAPEGLERCDIRLRQTGARLERRLDDRKCEGETFDDERVKPSREFGRRPGRCLGHGRNATTRRAQCRTRVAAVGRVFTRQNAFIAEGAEGRGPSAKKVLAAPGATDRDVSREKASTQRTLRRRAKTDAHGLQGWC